MKFDWVALAGAIWSVILLLVGAGITRLLERKPRVTCYATHWSAYPRAGPPPVTIHTHLIVIKNVGSKTATDVRIPHALRPETFFVSPQTPVKDPDLVGGGFEIVFDRLVPQQEVAISYMHTEPFNNFRGHITHADGRAVEVSAIPRAEYPRWLVRALLLLAVIGLIALVFLGITLAVRVLPWGG